MLDLLKSLLSNRTVSQLRPWSLTNACASLNIVDIRAACGFISPMLILHIVFFQTVSLMEINVTV